MTDNLPWDKQDEVAVTDPAPLKGKETARGRITRMVWALNSAMTLDPSVRLVSLGTRVEMREANGQYHDQGLDSVAEFHKVFDAHIAPEPSVPEYDKFTQDRLTTYTRLMAQIGENLKKCAAEAEERGDSGGALVLIRLQLCQEELAELAEGLLNRDPVECLDALTDMTYVADGTYLTLGLGHYKVAATAEVHRSNMTKLGPDGKPIISSAGRIVKGPDYSPPDLRSVLGLGPEIDDNYGADGSGGW